MAAKDNLVRLLFLALIISAIFLSKVVYSATPAIFQKKFEEGVLLMATNPNLAAEIFRELYFSTKEIRVQLELARSLYLAGRFNESKKEFIDVLNKPIPITVRDKVEWYLSEIQKQQSFKFTFGIFQDSNPGYITNARTVSILGQTLSYQPSKPAQTETGINIGAEAEREIIKGAGLYGQLSANTVTYQTSSYNKQTYDASLIKRWQGYDYKDLRIGFETMYFGGYTLYNYPYVSSRFIFNAKNQDYYGFFVKSGTLNYPSYTYLNGSQTQGNIFYNHNITRNLTAYVEVGGDITPASQPAYSAHGIYSTIGTQIGNDATHLQANIRATVSQRTYWESDPLWGEVRQDMGQTILFSLTKRNLYILGLRPSIDITYQTNNSSIPFFSFNKVFGGLFFKNVY